MATVTRPKLKSRYRILIIRECRVLKECGPSKGTSLKKAAGIARAMNLCLAKRHAVAVLAPVTSSVEGGAA